MPQSPLRADRIGSTTVSISTPMTLTQSRSTSNRCDAPPSSPTPRVPPSTPMRRRTGSSAVPPVDNVSRFLRLPRPVSSAGQPTTPSRRLAQHIRTTSSPNRPVTPPPRPSAPPTTPRQASISFSTLATPTTKVSHPSNVISSPVPIAPTRHRLSCANDPQASPIGVLQDSVEVEFEEVPSHSTMIFPRPPEEWKRTRRLANQTSDWDIMMDERRTKMVRESMQRVE